MTAKAEISTALARFLERARPSEARDLLHKEGFGGTRAEAWHYTSLRSVLQTEYAAPECLSVEKAQALLASQVPEAASGFRLVFLNGYGVPELTRLPPQIDVMPQSPVVSFDGVLPTLNAALQQAGFIVRVPEGVDAGVINLVALSSSTTPISTHLHHHIVLEKNAKLTLIDLQTAVGASLANPRVTIVLASDAHLTHLRVQNDDPTAVNLSFVKAEVAQGAVYDSFTLTLGARLSRHEVSVNVNGSQAQAHVNAVQLLSESQHADFTSVMTHAAPESSSRQTVKNVLFGAAKGVFQGKIIVQRPAQKTDAYQMNQALLLSDKAHINSKPELEIYADDVKCSHGATVGALDNQQLFYLRARGVPLQVARMMLIRAFLEDALSLVSNEAAQKALNRRIDAWWMSREI